MDANLSRKFAQIQLKLFNAIKSHQACYEKLQNGDQSSKVKDELLQLKKQMLQCNEEQKGLLHELNNRVVSDTFSFDLYKVPPAAMPKKNRRRKDHLIGRVESVKSTKEAIRTRSPSLSSSSSDSSLSPSSSDSEEECEKMKLKPTRASPKLSNVTLRSRPTLLPKKTQEAVKVTIQDVKPRNIVALTIERYYKLHKEKNSSNKDESEEEDQELAKVNFMASLNLMPKEIAPEIMEIINRKTERKRRSTANNQFVYNNDWDVPVVPRPKQYLSPVKSKVVSEDEKPDSPLESERMEMCKDCDTMAIAVECTKCMRLYHPKCPKVEEELMQSFLKCPKCFTQSSTIREIDNWSKREKSPIYCSEEIEERAKVRDHLKKLVRFRELEKTQLEKTVLKHTENIVLQKKVIDMQIKDGQELERKIQKITSFIQLFQKTVEKKSQIPDAKLQDTADTPVVLTEALENIPDSDIAEMDTQPVTEPDSLVTPVESTKAVNDFPNISDPDVNSDSVSRNIFDNDLNEDVEFLNELN